jgi:hypothetical protein
MEEVRWRFHVQLFWLRTLELMSSLIYVFEWLTDVFLTVADVLQPFYVYVEFVVLKIGETFFCCYGLNDEIFFCIKRNDQEYNHGARQAGRELIQSWVGKEELMVAQAVRVSRLPHIRCAFGTDYI